MATLTRRRSRGVLALALATSGCASSSRTWRSTDNEKSPIAITALSIDGNVDAASVSITNTGTSVVDISDAQLRAIAASAQFLFTHDSMPRTGRFTQTNEYMFIDYGEEWIRLQPGESRELHFGFRYTEVRDATGRRLRSADLEAANIYINTSIVFYSDGSRVESPMLWKGSL